MFAALVLVTVGIILLLSNLGYLQIDNRAALLHTWWPLILILVGLGMAVSRWKRNR